MKEDPNQMHFSDIKEGKSSDDKRREKPIIEEVIDCQYCQDGGPCAFCDRGQVEMQKEKNEAKARRRRN